MRRQKRTWLNPPHSSVTSSVVVAQIHRVTFLRVSTQTKLHKPTVHHTRSILHLPHPHRQHATHTVQIVLSIYYLLYSCHTTIMPYRTSPCQNTITLTYYTYRTPTTINQYRTPYRTSTCPGTGPPCTRPVGRRFPRPTRCRRQSCRRPPAATGPENIIINIKYEK